MVVVQLLERSLSAQEVRGSNPVIGNFINNPSTGFVHCIGDSKRKEKEAVFKKTEKTLN